MNSPRQRAIAEFVLDHLVWFMLAAVLIAFSIFVPNFFQIGIFANIVEQSTFVGVMAIGLAIVIIAGHMDLSVESTAALAAMITGILFCSHGIGLGITFTPEWLVIPISLAIALTVGGVIGFLNGFFTIKMKMNAFIVTLASYIWVRGLVVAISGGRSAQDLSPSLRVIGIEQSGHIKLVRNGFAHDSHFIELVLHRHRCGRLGAQAGPVPRRMALRQGLDRADGTFEKLFFGLALAGCGQAFGFLLRRREFDLHLRGAGIGKALIARIGRGLVALDDDFAPVQ